MNDMDFGARFDELRRVNRRNTIGKFKKIKKIVNFKFLETVSAVQNTSNESTNFKIDPILEQSIEEDPFFSAPIHASQIMQPNSTKNV